MAEEDKEESKKKDDDWMQKKWRPAMGWMYMIVCMADMVIFPVAWSILQVLNHQPQITQWNPLTLQGAGLFHIAMGAVLGISAFGRTQEKLAGTAANPTATSQTVTQNSNMTGMPAGGMNNGGGFNSGSSFGGSTGGFGSPAPVTNSFGSQPLGAGSTASSGGFGSSSGFGAGATGSSGFDTFASATPAVNAKGQKVVPPTDFPPI